MIINKMLKKNGFHGTHNQGCVLVTGTGMSPEGHRVFCLLGSFLRWEGGLGREAH